MKTYAFKVHRPEFDQHEMFLACAADHTSATHLLNGALDDPDRKIVDSRELQEGLAQFLGMSVGDVKYWAPFPK